MSKIIKAKLNINDLDTALEKKPELLSKALGALSRALQIPIRAFSVKGGTLRLLVADEHRITHEIRVKRGSIIYDDMIPQELLDKVKKVLEMLTSAVTAVELQESSGLKWSNLEDVRVEEDTLIMVYNQ